MPPKGFKVITIKNDTKSDVFSKNQLFYLDGFPLGAFNLGKC